MATSTTKRSSTGKATAAKTTPRKPATSIKPKAKTKTAAKAASASKVVSTKATQAPEPVVVVPNEVSAELPMRKKELIDLVVERSGIKKKDAKPVVEAMLAVLGETIGDGRELNMQPLGKLRINRSVERSNGRIIVCKIRQSTATSENTGVAEKNAISPLAEGEV